MLNDPLANIMSNITNAQKVGKVSCTAKPTSKIIKKVLDIMQDHHYMGKVEFLENNKGGQVIMNLLGTINKCGVIKPRFAIKKNGYEKFEKRFLPAKDFGILIISTSQGLMTHIEAKKKKIGGRLISYIY